jgi:hypothetical protein
VTSSVHNLSTNRQADPTLLIKNDCKQFVDMILAVTTRQAHNLKVAGSNPAPATNKTLKVRLPAWMTALLAQDGFKLKSLCR